MITCSASTYHAAAAFTATHPSLGWPQSGACPRSGKRLRSRCLVSIVATEEGPNLPTRLITTLAALVLVAGCAAQSDEADGAPAGSAAVRESDVPAVMAGTGKASRPEGSRATDVVVRAEQDACYSAGGLQGPDYDTAVACNKPHSTEVFLVHDMPAELVSEDRSAYLTGGRLAEAWTSWARVVCGSALQETTGLSAYADAFGVQPPGYVAPAFWGTWSYSLTPVKEWTAGARRTVCTATTSPASGSRPRPEPAGQWVPTLATDKQDVSLTVCATARSREYVPCGEQHYGERIGSFDAAHVPSLSGLLDTLDPAAPTGAQYALLDGVCDTAVSELGDDRFKGVAYTSPETWSGAGDRGQRLVSCFAQPRDKRLDAIGSIFAPGSLELVPAL